MADAWWTSGLKAMGEAAQQAAQAAQEAALEAQASAQATLAKGGVDKMLDQALESGTKLVQDMSLEPEGTGSSWDAPYAPPAAAASELPDVPTTTSAAPVSAAERDQAAEVLRATAAEALGELEQVRNELQAALREREGLEDRLARAEAGARKEQAAGQAALEAAEAARAALAQELAEVRAAGPTAEEERALREQLEAEAAAREALERSAAEETQRLEAELQKLRAAASKAAARPAEGGGKKGRKGKKGGKGPGKDPGALEKDLAAAAARAEALERSVEDLQGQNAKLAALNRGLEGQVAQLAKGAEEGGGAKTADLLGSLKDLVAENADAQSETSGAFMKLQDLALEAAALLDKGEEEAAALKAADVAQKEALAALQAQVEQLEAQRGELSAHEAEIAQLRKTVGERAAEISAIQDGATAASSMASESVKESKKQVDELTRALAAKDERLAALEAGAGGAAAAIAELEAENAAVKGQLEAATAGREGSEAQVAEQSGVIEDLRAQLSAKDEAREEAVAGAVKEALARQEEEAEATTLEACEVLQRRFKEVEGDLVAQIEDLQQALQDSEAEVHAMNAVADELDQAKKAKELLQQGAKAKDDSLGDLQDEVAALKAKLSEQEQSADVRSKRFLVVQNSFKAKEDAFVGTIEQLEAKVQALEEAAPRAEEENRKLRLELEDLKETESEMARSSEAERQQREKAEGEVKAANARYEELKGALSRANTLIRELKSEGEAQSHQLQVLEAQTAGRGGDAARHAALQDELDKARGDLAEAVEKAHICEQRSNAAEMAKINLSLQLAELTDAREAAAEGGDAAGGAPAPAGAAGDAPGTDVAELSKLELLEKLQVEQQRNKELAWQVKMAAEPEEGTGAGSLLGSLLGGVLG